VARAAAAREDISASKRAVIHEQLYRALLAADNVDEGIQELRKLISAPSPVSATRSSHPTSQSQLALQLVSLGQLLERKELIDEGLAHSNRGAGGLAGGVDPQEESRMLALSLIDLGRGVEAETVLAKALVKAEKLETPGAESWNPYRRLSPGEPLLESLAFLYLKVGRTNDILTLLDEAPYWGAKDLAELMTGANERFGLHGGLAHEAIGSLGHLTASALMANNRKTEAHRIVDALLDKNGGDDSAYELLLQLSGQNSIGRLDELFSRDSFEERPLIWKAVLLQKAGQLEEAEKFARQAISIDPSDGEQGPGHRMRAYAVLADIRAARGDFKEAEFLRGAVKAIRLSERADQFYAAGLITRAVKMYEEALTHFSDAYCIQSRLALRMSQLGLYDAAEAHYQKAYELMPDSFGRVESHCFGCEGVFNGKHPQDVAERVFQSLTNKSPYKPQVQYLFGYLRQQQGRYNESLSHFQNAVRLDPDYLNAWLKIQDSAGHVRLSPADRDQAAFNVIRLDPLGRHSSPNLGRVSDLRGLWNALEAAQEVHPKPAKELYPLKASAVAMEAAEHKKQPNSRFRMRTYFSGSELGTSKPADALAQNSFIRVAGELLDQSARAMMEE
jgi:tetratricopeptide (TPR) repeat protein